MVWRESYRGKVQGFPIQETRDAVNSAAAMGWAASFSMLVAFDRGERSSPAFLPLRFEEVPANPDLDLGNDLGLLLAPFGTLHGDQPDPRPERTGGSGLGARLTRMAPHMGPAGPAMAGRSEHFSLALGGVSARFDAAVSARPEVATQVAARNFATQPLVIRP